METTLSHPVEEVEHVVVTWNNVTAEPHRFGGREFKLNNTEIGHIHYSGMLDIPFSRAIRDLLLKTGQAKAHHFLPETGWISFPMKSNAASIDHGLRLLRLSYLFKAKRKKEVTLNVDEELIELEFGEEINALIL